MNRELTDSVVDASLFRTFGFLVLRKFFNPDPLGVEIDRVLHDGLKSSSEVSQYGEIHFQYVPMMTAETPASLALLDQTAAVAETLLDAPVVPTRAKGVRYFGNTPWHVDSVLPAASIGFAAYVEPLGAENGALRVLPGSHCQELGDAIRSLGGAGRAATDLPSHAVATEPGDVIVFDEHLFHASCGGRSRRQWRLDYVGCPAGAEAESRVKAYFVNLFSPDWDGGYDVDRYPSYGPEWRGSGRPAVARLEALGVYELAARQESGAARTPNSPNHRIDLRPTAS